MNALTRNLLWLGVEDYTGLWDAALEARATYGFHSVPEARESARRVIMSLLADGLIDLFMCQWPLDNDSVEVVMPQDRSAVLQDDASWTLERGETLVWFATTEKGFAFYQKETGWA